MLGLASLLCAPAAAHAARISLAWDASASTVNGYVIYYGTSPSSLTTAIDVGNQTSYPVDGLTAGVRYYFEVRAYNAQGVFSNPSNQVDGLAGNASFTDTLLPGMTPIRAVHISELRARINALRSATGLPQITWFDPVLTVGVTHVKAAHIAQMRAALNEVYSARSRPSPNYAENLAGGVTSIKVTHISELRAAVEAVE